MTSEYADYCIFTHKNYIKKSFRVKFNIFWGSFSYPHLPIKTGTCQQTCLSLDPFFSYH